MKIFELAGNNLAVLVLDTLLVVTLFTELPQQDRSRLETAVVKIALAIHHIVDSTNLHVAEVQHVQRSGRHYPRGEVVDTGVGVLCSCQEALLRDQPVAVLDAPLQVLCRSVGVDHCIQHLDRGSSELVFVAYLLTACLSNLFF